MSNQTESLPTIEGNVRIGLANAGHLQPADTGAVAALLRLARLCDSLMDAGETKDLAPLMARLHAIMDSLHMTPKSRADQAPIENKDKPSGQQLSENYLRLISSPSGEPASTGAKPRSASNAANGKPKRTTT